MQDVEIDVLDRLIAAPARQRHYSEADASVTSSMGNRV